METTAVFSVLPVVKVSECDTNGIDAGHNMASAEEKTAAKESG